MSHAGFGKTQRFRPLSPRLIFSLAALLHLAAFLALLSPSLLPVTLRVIFTLLLCVNLWWQWHRCLHGIEEIVWHTPDDWDVRDTHGQLLHGELLGESVLLPWFAMLRFRLENGRQCNAIILPGGLHKASLRRLYVSMR